MDEVPRVKKTCFLALFLFNPKKFTIFVETIKQTDMTKELISAEILRMRPLVEQVEYIYDIIDSHPNIKDAKELLLEYKPVMTALRDINIKRQRANDSFKDNQELKTDRVKRILEHEDMADLIREEKRQTTLDDLGIE